MTERKQSYGMVSVVSNKVTLNAASSPKEFPDFLETTAREKGFEVCFIFERFTGQVVELRVHPELKTKLKEKKDRVERRTREVEEAQAREVKGWSL